MEISASTVNILKNFASINSNIVIKPGNKLMTVAEARNVLAMADVEENFESNVGIYDLQEFLNVLNLVDRPTLRFEPKNMMIGGDGGRTLIKYFYADPEMLTAPTKPIDMPSREVEFELYQTTLSNLKKASSVLGHGQLVIEPSGGAIQLSVVDPENATSNAYTVEVAGDYESDNFKFVLNIANLKMIPNDYKVSISKKLIAEFVSPDSKVTYWVALEKSSEYGE
jgi:hypothetical protein